MSVMTKYLRQTCELKKVRRTSGGDAILDSSGDAEYLDSKVIKCRKESYIHDVETTNGAIVKSVKKYITVVEINIDDMIDGRYILSVRDYVDGRGQVVGYVSIT